MPVSTRLAGADETRSSAQAAANRPRWSPPRNSVRLNDSGSTWCTPAGISPRRPHTTYASIGCRFPAEGAARKYNRRGSADIAMRVTPTAWNSRRASCVSSSSVGPATCPVMAASASSPPGRRSVGKLRDGSPWYCLNGAGRFSTCMGTKSGWVHERSPGSPSSCALARR